MARPRRVVHACWYVQKNGLRSRGLSEGIAQYGVQFSIERTVDVSKKVACLVVLYVCASSIGYTAGGAHINVAAEWCS